MHDPFVVILGAGKPFAGTEPAALTQTSGGKRVLDWVKEAFTQALTEPEFHFVGGYRMDEIFDTYPDMHFSQNEAWESTGPVASLFAAPLPDDRPVYVCYADTVFEESAVGALDGTTTAAVDSTWQTRFQSRSAESLDRAEKVILEDTRLVDAGDDLSVEEADAEFTGLVRLTPDALERARSLWEARTLTPTADMPALLRALTATGIDVHAVDIGGNWAELETAADLSRFVGPAKALWAVLLAREKRKKRKRARRARDRGMVVLMDRYPQNQVGGINDGPLLGPWKTSDSRLLQRIADWEADIYDEIVSNPPDLLVKLEVTPDIAKERKPETPMAELQRKAAVVEALDYDGCRIISINADEELETVQRQIKRAVWEEIHTGGTSQEHC